MTLAATASTAENTTIALPFTIANVPTNYTAASISAVAGNTNLVSSVVIAGSGTNYTATVNLVAYKSGASSIILTATNGIFGAGSATNELTVTFVEYPIRFPPCSVPRYGG